MGLCSTKERLSHVLGALTKHSIISCFDHFLLKSGYKFEILKGIKEFGILLFLEVKKEWSHMLNKNFT
jgi:hypothetical protein